MEPPDFEQIARPLIDKLSDTMDPDGAADFVRRTMREVWNARGDADAQLVKAASYVDGGLTALEVRGLLNEIQREDR